MQSLRGLTRIGADRTDSEEARLQKALLVASTTMMASLAVLWGGLYAAFGAMLAAAIPLAYAAASFASLLVFARVRRYQLFRLSQLVLSLLLPFFLMLSLGSFAASSAVVLWSLTSPLGALVFAGRRPATGWFAAYLLLLVTGALLGQGHTNDLPDGFVTAFFVMNIAGVSLVAFILLQYFVGERDLAVTILDREHRWIRDAFSRYISPNLVRHLIEHPEQLTLGGERRECTFVLSDLAGFTALVEQAEPETVVMLLNEYLEGMTRIALEAEGTLDRIVGDAVSVMFSAPVAQPDHAQRSRTMQSARCAVHSRWMLSRAPSRHVSRVNMSCCEERGSVFARAPSSSATSGVETAWTTARSETPSTRRAGSRTRTATSAHGSASPPRRSPEYPASPAAASACSNCPGSARSWKPGSRYSPQHRPRTGPTPTKRRTNRWRISTPARWTRSGVSNTPTPATRSSAFTCDGSKAAKRALS